MMKSLHSKMVLLAICMLMLAFNARSQAFTENFDDVSLLSGNGWVITNASSSVGATSWYQGLATTSTPTPGPFNSYNGASNSYIAANHSSVNSSGTISTWLMTPNRTFRNGDVITFYTRKSAPDNYADRLEVRLSTNGASTNVGSALTVGDFTTKLFEINPGLTLGVYPTSWTLYTITISGLPAPTSGRIAFRYFVTNGGINGTNSDYIGLDNVVYTPYTCPAFTMTAGGALTGTSAGTAYSTTLTQTGALGAPNFAVTAGALPPGLTLAANGTISGTATATGTFNFTATVNDASGCSGSQSYSITVVCPANPITFPAPTALCSNDAPLSLGGLATPSGGTYSGTGVTAGEFDPAAGTQTITYDYTDPYGCPFSTAQTITVNTAPIVSHSSVADLCDNGAAITLSGASPAGGTYTGTGISGNDFDPSTGTQTINYEYTDANGCSNDVDFTINVNAAPTVTHGTVADLCENASPITLTGASPAGGTYTGTGVTGNDFNPSQGTQTINYSYTDANGCTNDVDFTISVNEAPVVSHSALSACSDADPITLSGGTPTGGVYTFGGSPVTSYDPADGAATFVYSYTDANGCVGTTSVALTINTAPQVIFSLPSTVCISDDISLNATPAGGTYTGTGVSGTTFTPATAGLGSHTITYEFTAGNGCSDEGSATIEVSPCLGTEENELANAVNIFPNPTTGQLNVSLTGFGNETNIEIVNVQGKRIYAMQVSATENFNQPLDISNFANGVYYIRISGKAGVVVKTIVKQ